jgi:diketogulonate reductase-like aldo/keto reductase
LGTWQTFDVEPEPAALRPVREVLAAFVTGDGSVVDSSPMYGRSEAVVGELAGELGIRKQLFLATKVWTSGREAGARQIDESFRRFRAERIDLLQVHNLLDWRVQLTTLRQLKDRKKVRYIGVTHYTASAHGQIAGVLRDEEIDFIQINYSLAEREAERELLPLALSKGVAVLINRPFAEGALFRAVRGKPLPAWAGDIGCSTWAQFFLKFIISHPAVTCVIPATAKIAHLAENLQAGSAPVPDAPTRERMARYFAGR